MATDFDDSRDWAIFVRDSKTMTNGNGFANRWSEQVLAALRAAGVLDNLVDSTTPPATDKLWLDKNTDPAVLKQWDSTGSSWVPMTYGRLFGLAALGTLAVTGGTANAVVVAQPNSAFQANRLYTLTPTANNTAGAVTIQVSGVGTYPVKYGNGANPLAAEFTNGRQAILFFDGTKFIVVFSVSDLNAAVTSAAASASAAATSAGNAATSESNAATSATNAANAATGVLTGATVDDTVDDTDEVIYKTGTTIKRATFAAGIIASIFKTARTIANARFQASTFGLMFGTFKMGFTGSLTADRNWAVPDAAGSLVDLSHLTYFGSFALSTAATDITGLPANMKRILVLFEDVSPNAASTPMLQFLVGGVAQTGTHDIFTSAVSTGGGAGVLDTIGVFANYTSSGVTGLLFSGVMEFMRTVAGTQKWASRMHMKTGNQQAAFNAGFATLSGDVNGLRITSFNGTALLSGAVKVYYEV